MSLYLIGDLQSCCTPFKRLLEKIDFSPSRDQIILLGDMVNRGPHTLETLDTIMQYGNAVRCLLGNHDIHFLGIAYGVRELRPHDTLAPILNSANKESYIEWFREQHLACFNKGWLMVHAGVAAAWTLEDTLSYAHEIEKIIQSPDIKDFLREIFADTPNRWSKDLTGIERLRFIVNALTRIRFCYSDGSLNFSYKKGMDDAPADLIPWFKLPNRKTQTTPIAFGHWSTLENIFPAPNLLALDTGCLWGGKLTTAHIKTYDPIEIIQVDCDTPLDPILGRSSKKQKI